MLDDKVVEMLVTLQHDYLEKERLSFEHNERSEKRKLFNTIIKCATALLIAAAYFIAAYGR